MSTAAKPLYANRAYALSYAKQGWPVFPLHEALGGNACTCGKQCGNPGKHPRTKNGLKDATTDPQRIHAWWTETPDAPIGIVCGDPQDLLVVDIDPRNGGNETWERLVEEHGPPITVRVKTGGGGEHLYFRAPKTPIKSRGNALGPGVDISSNGHYIVAPPSLHASGNRYEFALGAQPGDIELADCPDWIVELASKAKPKGKTKAVQDIPADTRGWLAVAFESWGKLGAWSPVAGAFFAACPWQHEHSDGRGDGNDSSCVVFPPTADRTMGWWKCEHAHCAGRSQDDVRRVIPESARKAADKVYPPKRQRDPVPALAPPSPRPAHDPETGEVQAFDWREELIRDDKGRTVSNLANAIKIVSNDKAWKGVLSYDRFADRITLKSPPWDRDLVSTVPVTTLTDEDAPRLSVWFQRTWALKISPEICWHVLGIVARQNSIHPVQDYLTRLKWDGVARLRTWVVKYLGAEDTPYHRRVGFRWMISAVARAMDPGCQADACLVLEGAQGAGKSRSARTLAGPDWYCDDVGDLRSKDSADALRGKWIVELGEMSSVRKADVELQKAYLSRRVDHYRPAYGRTTQDIPRQCVFVGTTNADEYQVDPTGLRRFWAVRCGTIDVEAIARDRDQLWAEAMHYHCEGEPHWLQPDEVPDQIAEQELRREVHPWQAKILDWCDQQVCAITIDRILEQCLVIDAAKRTRQDAREVGAILRANGWTTVGQRGSRSSRVKVWGKVEQ